MAQPMAQATVPAEIASSNSNLQDAIKNRADVRNTLEKILCLEGMIAAAVVDCRTGRCLHTAGRSAALRLGAFAFSAARMLATYAEMEGQTGITLEVEDVVITLRHQYHLVRRIPGDRFFLYAAFDRETTNLALARAQVALTATG